MTDPLCTADLCDAEVAGLRIVDMPWRSFGGIAAASGEVRLVRLYDDNRILFDLLDEPGRGRILTVAVESPARPAAVGENVARRALDNGWAGILIDGAIRDARILADIPLLIVARETRPFRLRTEARGEAVDQLTFGGVTVQVGDHAIVDEDGIIFVGPAAA